VNVDIPIPDQNTAHLRFKIKAVLDGAKEDMNEAVTQAVNQDFAALPSIVAHAAEGIQTSDPFVQSVISFNDTWGPVLQTLEFLQGVGNTLSEVRLSTAPFILSIT